VSTDKLVVATECNAARNTACESDRSHYQYYRCSRYAA